MIVTYRIEPAGIYGLQWPPAIQIGESEQAKRAIAPAQRAMSHESEMPHGAGDSRAKQYAPRVTEQQVAELFGLIDSGKSVTEAAQEIGIARHTAFRIMQRYEVDLSGVRNLMKAKAFEAIDAWEVAMQVGALKKGNHAPARDWLLHAGVIEPVQGDSAIGVKVQICIGTPEQPMRTASPQTLEAQLVTGASDGDIR